MSQKMQWLARLDEDLRERRVEDGFLCLTARTDEIFELNESQQGAADLLIRLAQWVDLGYRDGTLLRGLTSQVPQARRSSMSICEFLELKATEGFLAMDAEELDHAIATFDFVLRAEEELADQRNAAIAHFWKGQVASQEGRV